MHLLLAQKGTIAEAGEAIDLGQSPGTILFLSAADTEIAALAAAAGRLGEAMPPLRLANLLRLMHPMSVDTYGERTARHARLIVVRLLGGESYWPYGLEKLLSLAQETRLKLTVLPGDDKPDPGLDRFSTIPLSERDRLWRYLVEGGAANADHFLLACRAVALGGDWPPEAQPLLKAGVLEVGRDLRVDAFSDRHPGLEPGSMPNRLSETAGGGPAVFPDRLGGGRAEAWIPAQGRDDDIERGAPGAPPPPGGEVAPQARVGGNGFRHPTPALRASGRAARLSRPSDPQQGEGANRPVAAIVFYRALVQSGQTEPVEALAAAMREAGLDPLPIYVSSLKEPVSAETVRSLFARTPPAVVVNLTGFAVSSPGADRVPTVLEEGGALVLQAVLAGGTREAWSASTQGLSARDLAMNVALPEIDGRVLSRALAFKAAGEWDSRTETDIVAHRAVPDRVRFVAELAMRWARLRQKRPAERKVAILLANYPNRDGRLGNGVGLDTPAATIEVLRAMQGAGYAVDGIPADGNALIDHLMAGPTNAGTAMREIRETLPLKAYRRFFEALPPAVREAVTARWGLPEADPFVLADRSAFALPLARFGSAIVGIQPARGYNIDPKETYHSPDLVPPHNYLASYAFLRESFEADAIVHMGKHGNLEWLPGKALALSESCFPEAVLGPIPHLYPFIVNDPGEGTQAKRRSAAVIIDHLTPPLTRAESYGPLKDLEALVDEYYEAAGVDPRRLKLLKGRILDLVRDIGLDRDAGIAEADGEETALEKLDAYLCDLKEMQIRDGLHVFGKAPEGRLLTDLVVALARLPRGTEPGDASLHRAIATDLGLHLPPVGPRPSSRRHPGLEPGSTPDNLNEIASGGPAFFLDRFGGGNAEAWIPAQGRDDEEQRVAPTARRGPAQGRDDEEQRVAPTAGRGPSDRDPPHHGEGGAPFDPLDCDMAAAWNGPRPPVLHSLSTDPWRMAGDTVERIEMLAAKLVSGEIVPEPEWGATTAVLADVLQQLSPAVENSGPAEIAGLLAGLDGRFVPPGPSGAPTRGRPDVLPTGRNFFSVDTRAVPTQAAYTLGRKSAELLVTRHLQDQGEWPSSIGLTAWGTSNMRTGGDDIAQALALIGAKPVWDMASRRVTGYEIVTLAELGRPRVDVTLRISGFFRDAFPDQIALFDRAIRAVGALDEEPADNPIAARMRAEQASLVAAGMPETEAARRSGFRIFGSMPGAYGAGLQALIDEKGWEDKADFAESYLVWGSYAYGADAEGEAERATFETRLSGLEAVVQNQDNREHDLLDSDDYYQFEGGMTAAVEHVAGTRPVVYHNDHSRPERPVVRTLEEEIGRVVRARVVNPKWIAGVMRHGYKGAFEIAATVDYMFAFSATTGAVTDHHFEAVYRAFVVDERVRDFMLANNPHAFAEMTDRLGEAIDRGLWAPRSNSARAELQRASA